MAQALITPVSQTLLTSNLGARATSSSFDSNASFMHTASSFSNRAAPSAPVTAASLRVNRATIFTSLVTVTSPHRALQHSFPALRSRSVQTTRAAARGFATEESSSAAAEFEAMERTAATLYDLLGLPRRDVSLAEIKGAYRQLARRYHPDSRPAELSIEECTRRFIEVQEAYEILSDPQRRAMYDFEMLHPAASKGGRREAGWRRGVSRPWSMDDAVWMSPGEQADMHAAWRMQWEDQLSGLRQRGFGGRTKPGSWAARMRQQQQQQHGEEEHAGAAAV